MRIYQLLTARRFAGEGRRASRLICPVIHTAREAHDWFLSLIHQHEEFEVETDRAGEQPLSFWSETVRSVVAK